MRGNRMSKYTDRTDESVVISLHEHGCIRNPKNHRTIFMTPKNTLNGYKLRAVSTYISEEDVVDALEDLNDMDKGFFEFIGESYDDIMDGLDRDCLTPYITSLNDYNSWFTGHWT